MMNMRALNQLAATPEPPQLQSYLARKLDQQYRIEEGKSVTYKRPGYSFSNGVVMQMHLSVNAALVMWVDEHRYTHQAVCGLEFMRRAETKTATEVTV